MMGPMRYGFTPHGYGRRGGDTGRREDAQLRDQIFSIFNKIFYYKTFHTLDLLLQDLLVEDLLSSCLSRNMISISY